MTLGISPDTGFGETPFGGLCSVPGMAGSWTAGGAQPALRINQELRADRYCLAVFNATQHAVVPVGDRPQVDRSGLDCRALHHEHDRASSRMDHGAFRDRK